MTSQNRSRDQRVPADAARRRTHIHAFALDGGSTPATWPRATSTAPSGPLVARRAGRAPAGGRRLARSRRAAHATTGSSCWTSGVTGCETVGELRGLGVDEQIQSVRWFDDLAVVVTFRQTDPLYTIDLTDPTHPRRLGELKIPGFSAYLHPIGDDRLLGLGTDATPDGSPWVRRQRSSTSATGAGHARSTRSPSATARSGRARTRTRSPGCPAADAAITTLQARVPSRGWNRAWSRAWNRVWSRCDGPAMVLLRVSPSGRAVHRGAPSPGGWEQRALPLADGRVALTGSTVTLVDVG